MIVLIDTDVLIDLALDRKPFSEPAGQLLDYLDQHPGQAFAAWHSFSNLFYLVAPSRGKKQTKRFLLDLTRFLRVAETTTESLVYAGNLDFPDFEDAMQVAAAIACKAEAIATRNLRHYTRSPVQAMEPQALLKKLVSS